MTSWPSYSKARAVVAYCRRKKKCIKANDEGDEADDEATGEDSTGGGATWSPWQLTASDNRGSDHIKPDDTNSELLAQVKQEVDDSGLTSSTTPSLNRSS